MSDGRRLATLGPDIRREVRRAALQWLYRFDAAGTDDIEASSAVLPDEHDDASPAVIGRGLVVDRARPAKTAADTDTLGAGGNGVPDVVRLGFDLATLAWEFRNEADASVKPLVPEWPTHRQPVVDRSLFRLAWYEVVHAAVPPRVAIVEAVELAREFSTDRSPSFVNGVLDRLFRDRLGESNAPESGG